MSQSAFRLSPFVTAIVWHLPFRSLSFLSIPLPLAVSALCLCSTYPYFSLCPPVTKLFLYATHRTTKESHMDDIVTLGNAFMPLGKALMVSQILLLIVSILKVRTLANYRGVSLQSWEEDERRVDSDLCQWGRLPIRNITKYYDDGNEGGGDKMVQLIHVCGRAVSLTHGVVVLWIPCADFGPLYYVPLRTRKISLILN